jgi:broad specificity phosphatase PhoE
MQTCEIALANAGWNLTPRILNNGFEQSYGIMANLSIADLEQHHGKEQLRKQQLGYWAYEPEGGENWATVDERARRVLTIMRAQAAGKRAIFFGHQVFNHLLRRRIEDWSIEETVTGDLSISHNCAVTSYKLVRGKMVLNGECLRSRRLEELTPGH